MRNVKKYKLKKNDNPFNELPIPLLLMDFPIGLGYSCNKKKNK